MSERDAFDCIVASLHEAALDRERWSTAAGLIDDALRTHGNCMVFGEGTFEEDVRTYFAWCITRGQRQRELERAYFEDYYRRDERVPRLRRLPDSRLFHNTELYTEEERKTSTAYNELLVRHHTGNAINVRLDGPNGTRIVWVVSDPVDGNGWSSAQIDSIRDLLPHIRQTVRVQQALAGAGALGASLAKLLDTTGLGVVQLDGRWRVVAANDRARDLLRIGAGLLDDHGFLHAPGAARQPGGAAGRAGLAGRRARAGHRPGKLNPHRSGRGGGGSRAHGDGEPGGGAVGRRHEHPRDRRRHGPRGKHDPHACEAHVHQARPVASGGPGAACPVAGPRFGVPALKAQARRIGVESACCPVHVRIPPDSRRISPILGTRAAARLASLSFIPTFKLGAFALRGNATHGSFWLGNNPRERSSRGEEWGRFNGL